MKLCYRGIYYDYQPIEIQVRETSNTYKLKGNTDHFSHEVAIYKDREPKELIYRGVARSEARPTKFLGRVCDQNSLAISIASRPTRFLGQVRHQDFGVQIDSFARAIV